MLRAVDGEGELPGSGEESIRISSGSAVVLGLAKAHLEVAPTTAYVMLGERCSHNCLFCAQARGSAAGADQLSRVTWPSYPLSELLPKLAAAHERGSIERSCLQVTSDRGFVARARQVLSEIKAVSAIPVCVSIRAMSLDIFEGLLGLGADRVTLALDVVCAREYNRVKGGGWQAAVDLLCSAAGRYPGRVGTHIIIGLGETEAEAVALLQRMHDLGIVTALFAFTPVPGTALAEVPPPLLARYRRMQAARYLIVRDQVRAEQFAFSSSGEVISYGLDASTLRYALSGGEAFETSGCHGCNRPYYNERPGGPLYNYPRPLQPNEIAAAIALVSDNLADR